MRIIGVNGFKRSGKGETGNAIAAVLGGSVRLLGFADKLKILAAKSLGFIELSDAECIALMDECKESWEFAITKIGEMPADPAWMRMLTRITGGRAGRATKEPVTTITGRQYLQHLGTQARTVFGADFWVDQVLPRNAFDVAARYSGVDCVVLTDLRFPNEAKRILDLGGETWEVIRPGTESDGHDSELVLPRDLVIKQIRNDGTLDDLHRAVEKALG